LAKAPNGESHRVLEFEFAHVFRVRSGKVVSVVVRGRFHVDLGVLF
jgi:hypothetical protein